MDYIKIPMDIEKKSFEIIGEEMGEHNFSGKELSIIKRVIHTTADFDYKNIVYIRDGAIDEAVELLKNGTTIYTQTYYKRLLGRHGEMWIHTIDKSCLS